MPSLFAGDDGGENDEPYRDDPLASPPPGAPLESPAVGTGDAAGQMTPPGAETPPADLPRHGLRRRIYLLLPLLLTLYSLTDTNQTGAPPGGRGGRHLAFVTALARHPPSMRIFRLVFEGIFLLFCAAFALRVWECSYARATSDIGGADELEGSDGTFGDPSLGTVGNGLGAGGGLRRHEAGPRAEMTPEAVGRLLFAPPPDSVEGNAAYAAVRRRRDRRRGRIRERPEATDGPDEDRGDEKDEEDGDLSSQTPEKLSRPTSRHYPPSSASVLSTALHESTVLCMALILFTISSSEGGRYLDTPQTKVSSWSMAGVARVASPAFPLALFLRCAFRLVHPWSGRRDLWTVVSLTVGAPLYDVTFRDGFVGDVLTSAVRPLQDLAYTVFFLPAGFDAWRVGGLYSPGAGGGETFDDVASSVPLERNWALHTLVLPACAMSPMWWRYLQNLRRCHDTRRRWPHLGNAAKYLAAAEVACFASYDPSVRSNPVWITCFVVATVYQVWWDLFQDWGLLEWDVLERRFRLRPTRLYRRDWVYHAIAIGNACLRFVGMVTLIPPVYLSRATGLLVIGRGGPGVRMAAETAAACAELFRRTAWALLRVEWEVIRTEGASSSATVGIVMGRTDEDGPTAGDKPGLDSLGMEPMSIELSGDGRGRRARSLVSAIGARKWKGGVGLESLSDMSDLDGVQVLGELCVWATVFSGLAVVAAAHREVL